ncbi:MULTISPECIES: histidine kinase [Oscillospiraceae]|uniref:sensor histidine kinase n=1 Tax=Oscillospiraceae TaxID=216572 RepID=UPI0011065D51|nr:MULTISPECIES: histidine kinase [Oscillospiraceae]
MKRKNTLLKKIVILFLCLVFPLIIVWFFTLRYSNQILRQQVLSSIDSNNTTYISHLNNSLYTIYGSGFTLVRQSNLQTFSNGFSGLSTYGRSTQINLLREELSAIALSLPFCQSAHIFFENLGVMYNSDGYQLGSFTSITEEECETLKKISQETGAFHYYQNPLTGQEELACCLMPFSNASYGLIFVLSVSDLQSYMENNSSYENEYYLFTIGTQFSLTDMGKDMEEELQDMQERSTESDSTFPCEVITLDGIDYYAFVYEMPDISFQYIRLIPTADILNATSITPLLHLVFLLLISIACIVFFVEIYRLVHRPLVQLINAFREVEKGNFKVQIDNMNSPDFAYLYHAFNEMTKKLNQLIEKDYTQKLLLQKAELKQLQAQINPHFLYNSFFMLQRMIQTENIEDAQNIANALGLYFRYLTRNSMDHVTLAEEYEHAKNYAYIQGLRFTGRIRIDFEQLPDGFESIVVPKLILQPILENAFNYGLANKIKDGICQVCFYPSGDLLRIDIEDNGEELTDQKLRQLTQNLMKVREPGSDLEMSGILNIQRRLIIFSNTHDSLHVSRSSLGGLKVSITLDKKIKGDLTNETADR